MSEGKTPKDHKPLNEGELKGWGKDKPKTPTSQTLPPPAPKPKPKGNK